MIYKRISESYERPRSEGMNEVRITGRTRLPDSSGRPADPAAGGGRLPDTRRCRARTTTGPAEPPRRYAHRTNTPPGRDRRPCPAYGARSGALYGRTGTPRGSRTATGAYGSVATVEAPPRGIRHRGPTKPARAPTDVRRSPTWMLSARMPPTLRNHRRRGRRPGHTDEAADLVRRHLDIVDEPADHGETHLVVGLGTGLLRHRGGR